MKYIPQYYKIWNSEQVKFVSHMYDIWNCGPWTEIKYFATDLVLKIATCPIFMKFDTQNKSNMLIMSILIQIDDVDNPKLQVSKI